MDPDLYLLVARVRAHELQAEAERRRRTHRPAAWRDRLGWTLVETGLHLLSHPATREHAKGSSLPRGAFLRAR